MLNFRVLLLFLVMNQYLQSQNFTQIINNMDLFFRENNVNIFKEFTNLDLIDYKCEDCQLIVEKFNNFEFLQKFKKKVQFYVEVICEKTQPKETCPGYVQSFSPVIIKSLYQRYFNSKIICSKLKFCNFTEKTLNVQDFADQVFSINQTNQKQFNYDNQKSYKILHLTDLHFDGNYQEGSNAFCEFDQCCNKFDAQIDNNKALFWGTSAKCDLPLRTVNATIQWISKNLEFDLVFWTGDSASHDEWQQKGQTQIDNMSQITQLLKQYIDKPIIPIYGNHEAFPCDSFDVFNLTNNYNLLKKNEQAQNSLEMNGFYAMNDTQRNIKYIVINSQTFDNLNFYLLKNATDPNGMLEWLIQQLKQSEDINQDAFIIGHIPPGDKFAISSWTKRYQIIVDRFQKTIKAQFFGHTHNDQIQISESYYTKKPTNLIFIAPSLTTSQYLQPSFRVFDMNPNNTVNNYYQYRVNLTEANLDKTQLNYKLAYDFKSEYDLQNTQIETIYERFRNISQQNDMYLKYIKNFYSNSSYFQEKYDNFNNTYYQKFYQCQIKDIFDEYINCMGLQILEDKNSLIHKVIEYYSREWTIII